MEMTGTDAAELYGLLSGAGRRCWVGGGWGIDALLGQQYRPHHDLDVFLTVDDLPAVRVLLRAHGFRLKLVWGENRWLMEAGEDPEAEQATALVLIDGRGRELDIHVLRPDEGGRLIPAWRTDRLFGRDALSGCGVIAGRPVACLSAQMQVDSHAGYDLPQSHRDDLARLAGWLAVGTD